MKLKLTVENERVLRSPTADEIRGAVRRMTSQGGPGFVILEGRGDDYTQAAGGDGAFTAEWREYTADRFRHWKAGLPGGLTGGQDAIPTNGYQITVQQHERLTANDVEAILLAYLAGQPRPTQYVWRDISDMFT